MIKTRGIEWFLLAPRDLQLASVAGYFYFDVQELTDNSLLSGKKRKSLLVCSSENDVKNWMNNIVSVIQMQLDVEIIITDYLAG